MGLKQLPEVGVGFGPSGEQLEGPNLGESFAPPLLLCPKLVVFYNFLLGIPVQCLYQANCHTLLPDPISSIPGAHCYPRRLMTCFSLLSRVAMVCSGYFFIVSHCKGSMASSHGVSWIRYLSLLFILLPFLGSWGNRDHIRNRHIRL